MSNLTELAEWQLLVQHQQAMAELHMRALFASEPQRFQQFSLQAAGLMLDYSKNRITGETLHLLMQLAEKRQLRQSINDIFIGKAVNVTEHRPALHSALRCPADAAVLVGGQNVVPLVQAQLNKMEAFVNQIISGAFKGYTNETITDVVNIGVGGSNLGPQMAYNALKLYATSSLRVHFLSNIHSGNIKEVLAALNPARTLFIVSSKSFTTHETMENARSIQRWFEQQCHNAALFFKQAIAVTAQQSKALAWGFTADHIFELWDWVGGRYSIWSAIGFPVALAIGMDNFRALLAGAYAMDQHFQHAPFKENMPVIMAMLGIWYSNFFNITSHAIIPYNYYLRYLPQYLQQLDMESNGKQVCVDGNYSHVNTGVAIWGEMGTDSQHAFHQLLHQGTHWLPVDFIVDAARDADFPLHQDSAFVSCVGQACALMQGKTQQETYRELLAQGCTHEQAAALAPHKVYPGNRPSNTLVLTGLTPYNLGSLIALYEHKVFVQGVIWGINSFDQWGVELGKVKAQQVLHSFTDASLLEEYDNSSAALIKGYLERNGLAHR